MSPEVLEYVAPVLAILGVGSMVLIGMKLRYAHLRDTKHAPKTEQLEQLGDAVELLQDQVRVLRDEMVELNERVDFTERVLTRGRHDEEAEGVPPDAPKQPER